MDREELKEMINSVKNVSKDRNIIYNVLTELGIQFQRTNCHRCLTDLLNIAKEELGMIGSAADVSDFNESDYVYKMRRMTSWKGHLIGSGTQQEILRDFCSEHPEYCLKA